MKKSKFRLMALMMALLLTLTSCSRESSLAPAETPPREKRADDALLLARGGAALRPDAR